jgi:hypothetical protein
VVLTACSRGVRGSAVSTRDRCSLLSCNGGGRPRWPGYEMDLTGLPGLTRPWENQLVPAEGPKKSPAGTTRERTAVAAAALGGAPDARAAVIELSSMGSMRCAQFWYPGGFTAWTIREAACRRFRPVAPRIRAALVFLSVLRTGGPCRRLRVRRGSPSPLSAGMCTRWRRRWGCRCSPAPSMVRPMQQALVVRHVGEVWLAMHADLRSSVRCRVVADALAAGLAAYAE